MAKGYGVEVGDLTLIAVIAGGLYFLYNLVTKNPLAKGLTSLEQGAEAIGSGTSQVASDVYAGAKGVIEDAYSGAKNIITTAMTTGKDLLSNLFYPSSNYTNNAGVAAKASNSTQTPQQFNVTASPYQGVAGVNFSSINQKSDVAGINIARDNSGQPSIYVTAPSSYSLSSPLSSTEASQIAAAKSALSVAAKSQSSAFLDLAKKRGLIS